MTPFSRWMLLTGTLAIMALPARAFTVTKNINTGQAPADKVVIFDKSLPADLVTFFDNDSCKMTRLPDGAVESRIVGSGEVKCGFNWKPHGDLKETFNTKDYGYMVITCRLEGINKMVGANGKTTDQARPDNLWFSVSLFNEKGQAVGGANLADGADGKTPDKTYTVVLPMFLFTYFGDNDTTQIKGIGFTWGKTRPNLSRDFHLVIDKISLAN